MNEIKMNHDEIITFLNYDTQSLKDIMKRGLSSTSLNKIANACDDMIDEIRSQLNELDTSIEEEDSYHKVEEYETMIEVLKEKIEEIYSIKDMAEK